MILAIAAAVLVLVVILQNIIYSPLREETVSDGLYGPTHWFLDAAYMFLIGSLVYEVTLKVHTWHKWVAYTAAAALFITAISNTFSGFVDRYYSHVKIHTWFSIMMLVSMLGFERTQDHVPLLLYVTIGGLVLPAVVGALFSFWKKPAIVVGPAVEKAAILGLAVWLATWSYITG